MKLINTIDEFEELFLPHFNNPSGFLNDHKLSLEVLDHMLTNYEYDIPIDIPSEYYDYGNVDMSLFIKHFSKINNSKFIHDVTPNEKFITSVYEQLTSYNWIFIFMYCRLSENFILDNLHHTPNLDIILLNQKLSFSFIVKITEQYKVNFNTLVIYQELPYDFLEKNLYKYNLHSVDNISVNNVIIQELIKKHPHKYKIDCIANEIDK